MPIVDAINKIGWAGWFGIIGTLVTVGGIIFGVVKALSIQQPVYDKTNAETIQLLSAQVRTYSTQLLALQKQVEELSLAPSKMLELRTRFYAYPKPEIKDQTLTAIEPESNAQSRD